MRVMLYSHIPPCKNFTAGIVLNILCDFLLEAGHEVCCFAVKDKWVDAVIPEDKLARMEFFVIDAPRENWGRTRLNKLGSLIGNNGTALIQLPGIARQAGKFAKEHNVDLIWSVVQGQTMIKTTEAVARHAGVPYVVQVWDPPEWQMKEYGFDKYTRQSVLKAFGRALNHSKCHLAASWNMAEEYGKMYHCRAIPVILGFPPSRVIGKGEKRADEFIIALSGQIYAAEEFHALLQALNQLQWHFGRQKVKVRLYGRYFNLGFSLPACLEIRGWLDQDTLLSELADADLLYCPYWFNEEFRPMASLSFPSKLSTYLKSGTPVLVHGPEYASPRKFIEEHKAGYICGSPAPEGIKKVLIEIMQEPEENRKAVGERGFQLFVQSLTTAHMRDAFFQALDGSEGGNRDEYTACE